MGRSQETFNKKEIRNKKEKKRKEKEKKRLARKDDDKPSSLDDMIAYVDENGNITSTPPDPNKKTKVNAKDIEIGVPKKSEMDEEDRLHKGSVTFFNDSKGFGFIKDLDSKQSIFVHATDLLEDIKENNIVTYEIVKGHRGLAAVQVKLFKEEKPVSPPKEEKPASPPKDENSVGNKEVSSDG